MAKKRNYKKEYREYHAKPAQRRRNDARKKARRTMAKVGLVRKGDGKDVHHKNSNPKDNRRSNLQVMSKSKNRAKK